MVKILLVDDRPENLLALESLLKTPDIAFFRANSGVQALELLLAHEFAIAILDVQMPEMDGFELAELMRGTEQTRAVPIIFVTAGVHSRASTFRGYEKGAVDFLYKPLEPHIVKSKVQVFIDLAKQREQIRSQLQETQRALLQRDQALLEAREALRTRDEFVSIASHELKTPLTSLHLQLQLMTRSITKGLQAGVTASAPTVFKRLTHGIEVCERQSTKLSQLLDELLDLTRIRLGKLQLNPISMDLVDTVRDVLERFKNELSEKGITVKILMPSRSLGHWDPTRMDQIVSNLVSNAIKYGEGNPVAIALEPVESDRVRLTVSDQGRGVPPELQTRIFERFERAVSGHEISGLGLGLYITRQIVEAHWGTIAITSQPSLASGSIFTVELPTTGRSDLP